MVGALAGKNATFLSGSAVAGPTVTSSSATLYAGDGTNSTIENNNPYGTVTAFFGTGAGTGIGQGEYNTFSSDAGATDTFTFNFVASSFTPGLQQNVLLSNGNDTVAITRSEQFGLQTNSVTVGTTGIDKITLAESEALTFVNNSAAGISTISPSAGFSDDSISVSVSGAGSTSIVSGFGTQDLFFNTAGAGNTTLVGASGVGGDSEVLTFMNANRTVAGSGGATDTLTNYNGTAITLSGYGTVASAAYTATVTGGSTVLTLHDGTRLDFVGIGNATTLTSKIVLK